MPSLELFSSNYRVITQSLRYLTIPQLDGGLKRQPALPTIEAILVCSSLLLRQDLKEVFTLSGRDSNNMKDRLWIEGRINNLAMKTIEDVLVLEEWFRWHNDSRKPL